MVRASFVRLVMTALMLLGSLTIQAAELTLQLDAEGAERGKLLRAVLSSDQHELPLTQVDLSALEETFVIHRLGELKTSKGGQQRTLWLIPRTAGRQTLPVIALKELRSEPRSIDVAVAVDDKSGETIQIRFQPVPQAPLWPRQQALYRVEVISKDPYLQLGVEKMRHKGLQVYEMTQQTEAIERDGISLYRHTAGWAIFALTSGHFEFELPTVRYGREGIVSHRFFPSSQSLQVEPLPSYLPGHLPVGQLKLETSVGLTELVTTGRLQEYQVTITALGIPSRWLPRFTLNRDSQAAVERYRATIETQHRTERDGVVTVQRFTLPIRFNESGWHRLGPVDFLYLNPETRKLEGGQRWIMLPLALHPWQMIGLAILVLILLYSVIRWFAHKLRQVQERVRFYRQALGLLTQARDATQVRLAMKCVAQAESWSSNLSIDAWCARWRDKTDPDTINKWQQQFERCLYRDGENVRQLSEQLQKMLLNRLGIFKKLYQYRLNG